MLNAVSEEGLYEEAMTQARAIDEAVRAASSSSSPTTITHTPTSKGSFRKVWSSKRFPSTATPTPPSAEARTAPLLLGAHFHQGSRRCEGL